jgi:hypothetical protein
VEELTNPRIRQEVGQISLVPVARRVSGPGASYAMSPFVHLGKSSRFSTGDEYGVFYAARDFPTAVYEIAYHRGRFHGATNDQPLRTQERVLVGEIDSNFYDVRTGSWTAIHHPTDYNAAQALARDLRSSASNGIVYNSVRYRGGENFAAFWPDVMKIPIQTKHISYSWNGTYIDKYFDFETGDWTDLPNLLS